MASRMPVLLKSLLPVGGGHLAVPYSDGRGRVNEVEGIRDDVVTGLPEHLFVVQSLVHFFSSVCRSRAGPFDYTARRGAHVLTAKTGAKLSKE
jgi:hypothetical protein